MHLVVDLGDDDSMTDEDEGALSITIIGSEERDRFRNTYQHTHRREVLHERTVGIEVLDGYKKKASVLWHHPCLASDVFVQKCTGTLAVGHLVIIPPGCLYVVCDLEPLHRIILIFDFSIRIGLALQPVCWSGDDFILLIFLSSWAAYCPSTTGTPSSSIQSHLLLLNTCQDLGSPERRMLGSISKHSSRRRKTRVHLRRQSSFSMLFSPTNMHQRRYKYRKSTNPSGSAVE